LPRIPGNQQLEVDEHWVHPAAVAVVAAPGRVDGVTRFGRPDIPQSWVAVVAAAAIRYHSRSRNPQGCHVSLLPSGMAKSLISRMTYDKPQEQKGKRGKVELKGARNNRDSNAVCYKKIHNLHSVHRNAPKFLQQIDNLSYYNFGIQLQS
jgi:hypothetical protein